MNTFALHDGMKLYVRTDHGPWKKIVLRAGDFANIEAAVPAELAAVLVAAGVPATVDANDDLVLSSPTASGESAIEVDLTRSSITPAIRLVGGSASATGTGARAAAVTSRKQGPFPIEKDSEIELTVDGKTQTVTFTKVSAEGAAPRDVAEEINNVFPGLAHVARDRRVILVSPTTGSTSQISVAPATGRGAKDAARALGFVGPKASATGVDAPPGATEAPARLVVSAMVPKLRAQNLTAGAIQLVMVTRTATIQAGEALELTHAEAAHRPLQRLVERGAVRLAWTLG